MAVIFDPAALQLRGEKKSSKFLVKTNDFFQIDAGDFRNFFTGQIILL